MNHKTTKLKSTIAQVNSKDLLAQMSLTSFNFICKVIAFYLQSSTIEKQPKLAENRLTKRLTERLYCHGPNFPRFEIPQSVFLLAKSYKFCLD